MLTRIKLNLSFVRARNFIAVVVAALGGFFAAGSVPAHAEGDLYMGEVYLTAGWYCNRGSVEADGSLLRIADFTAAYSLFGTRFGGDGRTTFAVPDMTGQTGAGPHPFAEVGFRWCAQLLGQYPGSGDGGQERHDARPWGEFLATGAEFCPSGWVKGAQTLPAAQGSLLTCLFSKPQNPPPPVRHMLGRVLLWFDNRSCTADGMVNLGGKLNAGSDTSLHSVLGTPINLAGDFEVPYMESPHRAMQLCMVTNGYFPHRN